ncbi:EscU/YscU/HrcU family type III secretion system export apparatus switch protein [Treponema parvum]|uniref:EscU/YscU/HrcU family type III secretion system export apparatus switch protein n=1 Tax=Treponema parvum TaxID=138851 RepID=UPI001AEC1C19|nr:EscU/YscU/HrcU family type III secretion system export apparatus switch protein [Treponema parvum]QTQ16312.1 EscU/YscU/HrcU family type III secretion system export apparatus switch protein [Treponema parvum]
MKFYNLPFFIRQPHLHSRNAVYPRSLTGCNEIDLQWFAAEDEGRTEEPSEIKLQKARREGRVAKSNELNSALVLLFVVLTLILLGSWIFVKLREVMIFFFTRCTENQVNDPVFAAAGYRFLLMTVLPIALLGAAAGVAANIIQNRGFLYSTKPIEPKFSRILPHFGEYLRKTVFSFEGGFNVAKSLGKVAVIATIAYLLIRNDLPELLFMLQAGNVEGSVGRIAQMAAGLLVYVAVFFLAIAVPDYFVQRRQFMESMKMTKQEVKQEYKEMEGDPEVKNRLTRAQRELLSRNMPRAVAEADVIVTNPTHFAVSLSYQPDIADAPQVTAKGADEVAQVMKRIARENDVPIVENRPLARGLYAESRVGDIIPEVYINAIALVYRQIDYISKHKR